MSTELLLRQLPVPAPAGCGSVSVAGTLLGKTGVAGRLPRISDALLALPVTFSRWVKGSAPEPPLADGTVSGGLRGRAGREVGADAARDELVPVGFAEPTHPGAVRLPHRATR